MKQGLVRRDEILFFWWSSIMSENILFFGPPTTDGSTVLYASIFAKKYCTLSSWWYGYGTLKKLNWSTVRFKARSTQIVNIGYRTAILAQNVNELATSLTSVN